MWQAVLFWVCQVFPWPRHFFCKLSSFGYVKLCSDPRHEETSEGLSSVHRKLRLLCQLLSSSWPMTSRSLSSPWITLLSRTLELHRSMRWVWERACDIFQKCAPWHFGDLKSHKVSSFGEPKCSPQLKVTEAFQEPQTCNAYIKVWHLWIDTTFFLI